MKSIKYLLLVLCFTTAFSVAAYAGGGSCYSFQIGPGSTNCNKTYYAPPGTNVAWNLIIEGNNEKSFSYVSSYAAIIGPSLHTLQYKQSGLGYYHRQDYGNDYTSNGSYVYLYTGAEVGSGNDLGSGSSGSAGVSW
jgi:hypothetical protein